MCVKLSDRAHAELKKLGCNGRTFLRLAAKGRMGFRACIDSGHRPGDETVVNRKGIRVVTNASSLPLVDDAFIDFDGTFSFRRQGE